MFKAAVFRLESEKDAGVIRGVCDDKNLVFIEDAARAHGAEYRGTRTGALGRPRLLLILRHEKPGDRGGGNGDDGIGRV